MSAASKAGVGLQCSVGDDDSGGGGGDDGGDSSGGGEAKKGAKQAAKQAKQEAKESKAREAKEAKEAKKRQKDLGSATSEFSVAKTPKEAARESTNDGDDDDDGGGKVSDATPRAIVSGPVWECELRLRRGGRERTRRVYGAVSSLPAGSPRAAPA